MNKLIKKINVNFTFGYLNEMIDSFTGVFQSFYLSLFLSLSLSLSLSFSLFHTNTHTLPFTSITKQDLFWDISQMKLLPYLWYVI